MRILLLQKRDFSRKCAAILVKTIIFLQTWKMVLDYQSYNLRDRKSKLVFDQIHDYFSCFQKYFCVLLLLSSSNHFTLIIFLITEEYVIKIYYFLYFKYNFDQSYYLNKSYFNYFGVIDALAQVKDKQEKFNRILKFHMDE